MLPFLVSFSDRTTIYLNYASNWAGGYVRRFNRWIKKKEKQVSLNDIEWELFNLLIIASVDNKHRHRFFAFYTNAEWSQG